MATVEQTAPPTDEQRVVIARVDWPSYLKIGEGLRERRIRLTYDRGRLEIMTTSPRHETWRRFIGHLVEALCEDMGIDVACYGSFTMQREELERGMEPDDCYYIQHEPLVRGRLDLDLESDPPPDLVIEVEVSRSLLDRLGILAAMGVGEVWRFDGQTLRVMRLTPDGTYAPDTQSGCFPFLPIDEFAGYIRMRDGMGDAQILRAFRAWVRANLAPPPPAGGTP
jgi:Uma2 family endonuclease